MPPQPVKGKIRISATFCIATKTDPGHPVNYTRGGVDITFRPNSNNIKERKDKNRKKTGVKKAHPETDTFFQSSPYLTESAARKDAHKWETTLCGTRTKMADKLIDPCFDIHYNPREGSADARNPEKIPYALIVTVHSENIADLYDQVFQRYRAVLEPLRPRFRIQL